MPELPEVETIKRGLEKRVVGREIVDVVYDTPKMLQPNPKTLLASVVGTKVVKVARRAKLVLIYLSNGNILVIHLKLMGRLLFRNKRAPEDDWQHVVLKFDGDEELRFCDMRKFGFVRLIVGEKELSSLLSEFGPEPLTSEFTKEKFEGILRTTRPIKIVLMDQKKIAGVGNIYANEALFWAGIHPEVKSNRLSGEQASRLYEALNKVLKKGIKYGGATGSDQAYRNIEGEVGRFQEHFAVYGREREKCARCSSRIERIKLGGRGTFFCPKCQPKSAIH